MIKLLWCGHLARYVYLIAEGSAVLYLPKTLIPDNFVNQSQKSNTQT